MKEGTVAGNRRNVNGCRRSECRRISSVLGLSPGLSLDVKRSMPTTYHVVKTPVISYRWRVCNLKLFLLLSGYGAAVYTVS